MATNGLTRTTKKQGHCTGLYIMWKECEETWQLALQLWHIVCLEDHRLFAKCQTKL